VDWIQEAQKYRKEKIMKDITLYSFHIKEGNIFNGHGSVVG
jgi:hypothetical protein